MAKLGGALLSAPNKPQVALPTVPSASDSTMNGGRPKALEGKRGDSTHWLSLGDQAPPRHLGTVQSMAA
ncbi:hypothetical protein FOCG_04239 [Fusarium oxysporum f. sp. radicis-lycopersici 26381]|uniref:Uncharacterized protein n=1 Tax=Fusarium oxysporum Fo47 TaxID=660027 RepID=W9K3J7_FUSOX|nr:hypothetical protein FOZG_11056 [Fusarium oxysporum Fo47]EXL56743.1 hypothetical protein FOCG_04239 [Fusarium oxysporum f. sp. radicis-lycopersici 26381]